MDEDIYIDDGDPRNARVRVVRTPFGLRPGTAPAGIRPTAFTGAQYQPPTYYQQPSYQAAPVVVQRPRRFLDMPTGEVLSLAAQAFAALQQLPAAPVPIGKADDDAANLITYQSALATHAKRDEQLRTLGALVASLLR